MQRAYRKALDRPESAKEIQMDIEQYLKTISKKSHDIRLK
jgi:hypothetical protein